MPNLILTLEARISQFITDMNNASSSTTSSMGKMQAAAKVATVAITALAGVVVSGAFASLVKGSIDAADSMRDMSQKTGIAVEELNGLGFAAGQAGGSLESMVAAAGKLNKSIAEAQDPASKSAQAFKALGIDTVDAAGNLKKADVVMAELADQFAKYQDGPEKAAIALAVFGKSGADMIPMLNDGGKAMRENTEYAKKYSGMTTELSNASDNFNDTVGKLEVQQKSFGNAMATAVLPILQSVANEILGATEQSNKFSTASEMLRKVLTNFVVVGAEVAYTFRRVGEEMAGTAAKLTSLKNMDMNQFSAISGAMADDQAKARAEHEAFIDSLVHPKTETTFRVWTPESNGKPPAPQLGASGKSTTKTASPKEGKSDEEKSLESGAKMVESLKRQEAALGLTGVSLLTFNMSWDGYSEKQIQAAAASQTAIEAFNAEEAAVKELTESQKKAREQNAANVEQIRTGLLTETAAQEEAHQQRLTDLQTFHDAKLENVKAANALIKAENDRHEKAKADTQAMYDLQSVQMAGDVAGQLYGLMKNAGKEQSALGKAAFIASKALAVAEIIMQAHVAASKASGQLGIFGIPMATMILAQGYASAGMVAGMAIAEVSAEGGYDIPGGFNPVAQLHEKEMVLPKAQAEVIRGLASGGGGGGDTKFTIVNQTTGRIDNVIEQRISPTERALIIQEAVGATAAQFSDPNSTTSRSMSRNFNVPRSRS